MSENKNKSKLLDSVNNLSNKDNIDNNNNKDSETIPYEDKEKINVQYDDETKKPKTISLSNNNKGRKLRIHIDNNENFYLIIQYPNLYYELLDENEPDPLNNKIFFDNDDYSLVHKQISYNGKRNDEGVPNGSGHLYDEGEKTEYDGFFKNGIFQYGTIKKTINFNNIKEKDRTIKKTIEKQKGNFANGDFITQLYSFTYNADNPLDETNNLKIIREALYKDNQEYYIKDKEEQKIRHNNGRIYTKRKEKFFDNSLKKKELNKDTINELNKEIEQKKVEISNYRIDNNVKENKKNNGIPVIEPYMLMKNKPKNKYKNSITKVVNEKDKLLSRQKEVKITKEEIVNFALYFFEGDKEICEDINNNLLRKLTEEKKTDQNIDNEEVIENIDNEEVIKSTNTKKSSFSIKDICNCCCINSF